MSVYQVDIYIHRFKTEVPRRRCTAQCRFCSTDYLRPGACLDTRLGEGVSRTFSGEGQKLAPPPQITVLLRNNYVFFAYFSTFLHFFLQKLSLFLSFSFSIPGEVPQKSGQGEKVPPLITPTAYASYSGRERAIQINPHNSISEMSTCRQGKCHYKVQQR